VRIHNDASQISWAEAAGLFQLVGWEARLPSDLELAFSRSVAQAFAFHGSNLVGFARAVGDGVYYASLVDVIVHPEFQRAGVGSALVEHIQAGLTYPLLLTLTAAPEVQPFYRRLGWLPQTTAMIRPRSLKQATLNCPPHTSSGD
jgi:aralkylamine N-acetyltransferase